MPKLILALQETRTTLLIALRSLVTVATAAEYLPRVPGHTKNLDYPNHGFRHPQDHQRPTKAKPQLGNENIFRDNTVNTALKVSMERWTSMMSSGALLLRFTTEIANEKESEGPRTATGIGTGMVGILVATATLAVAEAAVLVGAEQIGVHRQQTLPGTGRWPRDWDYESDLLS